MTDSTQPMQAAQQEAMRLTRAGRLEEATALIQRALRGLPVAGPTDAGTPTPRLEAPTLELTARRVSETTSDTGARPETQAAGDGWTDRQHGPRTFAEETRPEGLRGVVDRAAELVRGFGKSFDKGFGLDKGFDGSFAKNGAEGLAKSLPKDFAKSLPDALAPLLQGLGSLGGLGGRTAEARDQEKPLPDGGSFVTRSHSGPEGGRDYKLFIPSRPQPGARMVVMLHGCTQSPDDFAAGTGMNALAEAEGFFVVYPAQSSRANGQRCWNWFEPRDQARGSGEAEIVAGLTRAVMAEHDIDARRVYIAGLSAGGAAAANIARAYPELYAAVGVHSGLAAGCARDLTSALMAMRAGAPGGSEPNGFGAPVAGLPPTIVFHGDADSTVSPKNGPAILAQAGAGALRPETDSAEGTGNGHRYTRTRYRDDQGRTVLESWLVHGAGHAWSGGDTAGTYTDPRGPDASRAMLAFFAEHPAGPAGRA